MKRLVIAVDCDDVLVRTTPYFVHAYTQTYGGAVTLDRAHDADYGMWGTDKLTLEKRLAELMETDEYKSISPTAEEVEVLSEMSRHHELHVITARRPHERELTQHMLDTYLPGVFTSLELVGFTGSKGEVCQRIGADVLIDDNLRHLEDAVREGLPQSGALLFGDYPWTAYESIPEGLTRCLNWADVAKEIQDLAQH